MPPAPSDSPVGRASGPVDRPGSERVGKQDGSGRSRRRRPATSRSARPTAPAAPRSTPHPAPRAASPPPTRTRGTQGAGVPDPRSRTALETLLADLGSQIQRGPARETAEHSLGASGPRCHPTGLEALDARLGGGFPHGRLSELCGAEAGHGTPARTTGRTALAHALVAETLARGVLVAWIDLADAFDPNAALAAIRARGDAPEAESMLDRLLWVRAQTEDEALRCCERIMRTEGFELVVFDVLRAPAETAAPAEPTRRSRHGRERPRRRARTAPPLRDVTWLRLARLAPATRTALVALTDEPSTGSRADLVLELRPEAPRFTPPPHLLESIGTRAVLRRHRSRPRSETVLELEAGEALPQTSSADDTPGR